jgi:hypothetical protein
MLMLIQAEGTTPQIQIAQETVIAIIVASTLVVLGLLWLIGHFASKAPTNEGPLHYGNFFVVIFGIMTVLIGFLIAFPLVISNVFTDPTQVIALLSALFGTVVGLVGTYFGVKSSSDASQKAQDLSEKAQDLANETTRRSTGWPSGSRGGPAGETPNGAASEAGPAPTSGTASEEAPRRSTAAVSTRDPGQTGSQGDQTGRDSSPQEESEKNR